MKFTLPAVRDFDDYHEIEYVKEILNSFAEKRIKAKELPSTAGRYWGIFYVDNLPPKKEMDKLLEKAGWIDEDKIWKTT